MYLPKHAGLTQQQIKHMKTTREGAAQPEASSRQQAEAAAAQPETTHV
jgi:hypothetical protein